MSIETIFGIVIVLSLLGVIILWVEGIDYMNKNHPDYKGEEFFNEEEERKDYDEN
jgi:hypothetical protein